MIPDKVGDTESAIPALRFVVIGTGRSGTGFTATILQRAGIAIDHELVFTEAGPQPAGDREGDSSWMAVPYLDRFKGAVLHQVREPLAVIDSLLDLGLFAADFSDEIHRPWRRFLENHFTLTGDPILDVMRFYVEWNQRCEAHAHVRARVEDQGFLIAEFIETIYSGKGVLVNKEISRASTTMNSREERLVRRNRAGGLSLQDLPKGKELDALRSMAGRYGYPWAAD